VSLYVVVMARPLHLGVRSLAVIWLAKLVGVLSRLLGRGGGSAVPGLVAERLDADLLTRLGQRLPSGCIVVTGTNGKTTTTRMIQEVLVHEGYEVITNGSGSNLSRGVLSTLVSAVGWRGTFPSAIGLFELDEASMPAVCRALQPQAVVILGLFRDQLDRYGELDSTAKIIGRAIEALDADVYLNADDPLVASLSRFVRPSDPVTGLPRVHYFGIEDARTEKLTHDLAADSDHCPLCGAPLEFRRTFYGHVGHYECPTGDFARPTPDIRVTSFEPGRPFEVVHDGHRAMVSLPMPGLYNAYNAVAALAPLTGLGIDLEQAAVPLGRTRAAFGRFEQLKVDGRDVCLLLVKNPTGFNQVIQTFLVAEPHSLMIAVNDGTADGRDVSWLWDVAFDDLAHRGHGIIASGVRATDLALRLKYAGETATIEESVEAAFDLAVARAEAGETVYILPTYTSMLELRARLRARGLVEGRWR
jgi:UDP-N-acetylmuramyl tripeptide synthase